jgi:hypothetical protein
MLGYLSVRDAHGVDCFELNLAAGRPDPEKLPPMGAMIGFVGRHDIAIRTLPVDLRVEIRKRRTQPVVEIARAGLVRRAAGLRRMVEEIVCEQLLEQFEIASALDSSVLRRTTALAASLIELSVIFYSPSAGSVAARRCGSLSALKASDRHAAIYNKHLPEGSHSLGAQFVPSRGSSKHPGRPEVRVPLSSPAPDSNKGPAAS